MEVSQRAVDCVGLVHPPNELLNTGSLVALGGSDVSKDTQHRTQFSIRSSEGVFVLKIRNLWVGVAE